MRAYFPLNFEEPLSSSVTLRTRVSGSANNNVVRSHMALFR